jgi:hypothetical protein
VENRQEWFAFGPAAICLALHRPTPPVSDIYFVGQRPNRDEVVALLGSASLQQIRYQNERPASVINLDDVEVRLNGKMPEFLDPGSVLSTRKISILNHNFDLRNSMRLWRLMTFFTEFDWPLHLRMKLGSDYQFAMNSAAIDDELRLTYFNLEFDFVD